MKAKDVKIGRKYRVVREDGCHRKGDIITIAEKFNGDNALFYTEESMYPIECRSIEPLNGGEDKALNIIREMQSSLKEVREDKERLEKELEDMGYRVSYAMHINNTSQCYCNKGEVSVTTRARLAENDVEVRLLGKYLALSRAYEYIIEVGWIV